VPLRALLVLLLLGFLGGCTQEAPPLPPVPNAPEDLSTWAVPELVQPPPPPPPDPVAAPLKEKPSPAEQVFDYAPGATYALTVPVNAPLDIVLERGEHLRNLIGGDQKPVEVGHGADPGTAQSPWSLKEGAHGTGETLRSHLFLTVTKPGLSAGFIITTSVRTYYLQCKSVTKTPIRTVRWRFPADPVVPPPVQEPGLLPDPAVSKRYHVGYELTSLQPQPPEWQPRHIVDDGKKMYLVLPEITLFETAPMVRMVGPNGPSLVNARTYLNVIIVDQLAPRLELRVGLGETAEVVQIARGALRTIQCPEAPECPVWPQAAQVLAQKSPPVGRPSPSIPPGPPPAAVPPGPPSPPVLQKRVKAAAPVGPVGGEQP
jgi:type IV secretory pathway VirB9-like protein